MKKPLPTFDDVLNDYIPLRQAIPEQKLWARVLGFGIRDALCGDKKAISWLYDRDPKKVKEIGSAQWICAELDFNFLEILRQMIKTTDEEKIEILKRELT